jgi:hypothetical protein
MPREAASASKLSDAVEQRRMLWVLCRSYGHVWRIHPKNLVWKLRGDIGLHDLAERLRCRRCDKARATVIADDRDGWPAR